MIHCGKSNGRRPLPHPIPLPTSTRILSVEFAHTRNYPYQAAWVQATHHPRREPS